MIGRPDPKWQEVPVAYIVLRTGSVGDGRRDRGVLSRRSSPASRCRASIVFVDDLPRNAMGKVQHFKLKDEIGKQD